MRDSCRRLAMKEAVCMSKKLPGRAVDHLPGARFVRHQGYGRNDPMIKCNFVPCGDGHRVPSSPCSKQSVASSARTFSKLWYCVLPCTSCCNYTPNRIKPPVTLRPYFHVGSPWRWPSLLSAGWCTSRISRWQHHLPYNGNRT